jgi:hypothetical protein
MFSVLRCLAVIACAVFRVNVQTWAFLEALYKTGSMPALYKAFENVGETLNNSQRSVWPVHES